MLPSVRCRFDFERERDFDDLMGSYMSEPVAVILPAPVRVRRQKAGRSRETSYFRARRSGQ
jgi:hypothetical protein